MKITLERLREIITEEVIKEEVSPEDAKRTMVALLQGTPPNVTGDIMGAVYDEMYAADVSEPSPEPEEEEDFPTEYQGGGAYGDRPTMGFNENMNEIIQEEYYIYMIEKEYGTLTEVYGSERAQAVASSKVLRPTQISPVDKYPGFEQVLADPASVRADILAAELAKKQYEFLQKLAAGSVEQIKNIDIYWQKYLNLGGSIRDAMALAPEGTNIVASLGKLYQRLRNREQHTQ